jgi:hypothetical protein
MWQAINKCTRLALMSLLIAQASALAAGPAAAGDAASLFAMLSSDSQGLRWNGLKVGMTLRQLEQTNGSPIDPKAMHTNLCGGVSVRRMVHGREVDIDLVGSRGEETVAGIFIPLADAEKSMARAELGAALRHRIADLQYKPSRHEPALSEAANPWPVYQLKGKPEMVIFLKPGEGVYIGLEACLG